MKKKITHDDYLRFLGLVKLVEDHDRALEWLHRSANLLGYKGEEPYLDNFYGSHAYDAMHGSRPPREALQLMEIDIEPPIEPEPDAPRVFDAREPGNGETP